LIAGIAGAMVSGADTAILYDTFKELKRENKFLSFSALVGLVIRLSLAVGTLIGGFLYLIDIRFPYLFMGLFYLVSGVIYFWVEEPAIDSQKFTLVNYVKQTKSGLMELVKRPFTKQLSIYYVMVGGITWACLDYFNQPFAKNSGFTEMGMTWLFTFTYTVSAIILYYLVRHAKFLTRQRIYLGLPIIMVLGLLPGIFVPQWLVPVSILLVQIAGSGRFTFLDKFTNMEFESRYRATAISSLNMLVSIFVIILYAISGFIQDLWGTRIIYTGLGILTLIIVLPRAFILIRHHRNNTV
jgi:MFS family permease